MFFYEWPGHEIGTGHFHTQFLGLIAAGDNATVVVTQYHNWTIAQLRFEQSFTRTVKVVAIDDRFHILELIPQPKE
jgi:hypothetical protein